MVDNTTKRFQFQVANLSVKIIVKKFNDGYAIERTEKNKDQPHLIFNFVFPSKESLQEFFMRDPYYSLFQNSIVLP